MGFAKAARRFANQGAIHTQDTYGGDFADGTSDVDGNNLQLVAAPQTKFRAAFALFATRRDIEIAGFVVDCHAAITVRDELDLEFALGDELTYLPDSTVYVVCELGKRSATSVAQRYALRRENPTPP